MERADGKTGRRKKTQIWPRYHQLDAVRRLLADAGAHGADRRCPIQHSAGSGKSNMAALVRPPLAGVDLPENPFRLPSSWLDEGCE